MSDSVMPPAADEQVQELEPRVLVRQLAIGLVILLAGVAALAVVLNEPLTAFSEVFVTHFGLAGVFVGVIITDAFVGTNEPLMLFAYAGGLGFMPIFVTASTASVLAGLLGWVLGGLLGRFAYVQNLFVRYKINPFMQRYGFWAVTVAALTPFPFSVATWASGAARVSFWVVFAGSLFRIPKTLFYLGVIVFGWEMVPKLFD